MEGMMDGMKKQMAMNIPQMVIMGWISFFFHGFLVSAYHVAPRVLPRADNCSHS
jgi:hypothetical protein